MSSRTDLATLLEQRAAEAPNRPFLVMAEQLRLTYGEFNERVNNLAHGLAAEGVAAGDRVAIMLSNSLEFLLASYALKKLGAIEVAINTGFRGAGLVHVVNLTEARLMITEDEFVEPVAQVREKLEYLRTVAIVGESAAAPRALAGLEIGAFDDLLPARGENPSREMRDTDLGTVLFTSGTTGPSKGCMLSHRYGVRTAEVIADAIGLREDDCLYCPFPLYHVDAAFLTVAPAIVLGARAAIGRRFSASGFWDEVREFEATVFDFMGATLTILWKRDELPEDADNPVRLAWGVPMPAWRQQFERRFNLKLVHGYGLTDGGMTCWEDPEAEEPTGSCGRPRHPYEVRILNDEDDEVPRGEVGEIAIRPLEADVVMKGYWGMPEATLSTFRNLWLHTGDYGRMDAQDHLFFEGRKNDAIRRRGENISAWEIEEVIHEHPAVAEAVAVGVPSELTEEDVKVYVVLRDGAALDEDELRDFCSPRMARFMVPEYVEFIEEIPKTSTGKPEKYKLLARHAAASQP
ncbi:MAG TPA: AMP-binding protein [Solirubrobacterales bacterium]|nr:AMP-binding protein [Solirubrobacterales bacterium]